MNAPADKLLNRFEWSHCGMNRSGDGNYLLAHDDTIKAVKCHHDLLAACKAASDLLLRCDAEIRPNDLPQATNEYWDRVAAQLKDAVKKAEGALARL